MSFENGWVEARPLERRATGRSKPLESFGRSYGGETEAFRYAYIEDERSNDDRGARREREERGARDRRSLTTYCRLISTAEGVVKIGSETLAQRGLLFAWFDVLTFSESLSRVLFRRRVVTRRGTTKDHLDLGTLVLHVQATRRDMASSLAKSGRYS
jgi:hypothetical protein